MVRVRVVEDAQDLLVRQRRAASAPPAQHGYMRSVFIHSMRGLHETWWQRTAAGQWQRAHGPETDTYMKICDGMNVSTELNSSREISPSLFMSKWQNRRCEQRPASQCTARLISSQSFSCIESRNLRVQCVTYRHRDSSSAI